MALPVLNFPQINVRFQNNAKSTLQVFDIVRKKFVDLTPEEWVRQHLIHYLINEKQFPLSVISVEKQLVLNGTKKRYDVVVFSNTLQPLLIIECKAPNIKLTNQTLQQALRYNLNLQVPYVFITNGLQHAVLNFRNKIAVVEKEIPNYNELLIL